MHYDADDSRNICVCDCLQLLQEEVTRLNADIACCGDRPRPYDLCRRGAILRRVKMSYCDIRIELSQLFTNYIYLLTCMCDPVTKQYNLVLVLWQ